MFSLQTPNPIRNTTPRCSPKQKSQIAEKKVGDETSAASRVFFFLKIHLCAGLHRLNITVSSTWLMPIPLRDVGQKVVGCQLIRCSFHDVPISGKAEETTGNTTFCFETS